jgi:hypothetical protein
VSGKSITGQANNQHVRRLNCVIFSFISSGLLAPKQCQTFLLEIIWNHIVQSTQLGENLAEKGVRLTHRWINIRKPGYGCCLPSLSAQPDMASLERRCITLKWACVSAWADRELQKQGVEILESTSTRNFQLLISDSTSAKSRSTRVVKRALTEHESQW